MGGSLTKIDKQYGRISDFWTQFYEELVEPFAGGKSAGGTDTGSDLSEEPKDEPKNKGKKHKKKDKKKKKKKDKKIKERKELSLSALDRYMAWTRECAQDSAKIFHPADYEYLASQLEPAQLKRIVDLVFPPGAPAPAAPQHIKGDPRTARFVVVTMRPTKPARLKRVSADTQREGFEAELQESARIIEDAADAILVQLGATADPHSTRGLRMDLRDKAAVVSSAPEFAPYGAKAKKGRRLREEQARLLAQLGVDSTAIDSAINAAGVDPELVKQAINTYYDGSAWRLLAQSAVLDSHIAGGDDWYGWLNHDRAYQANNSLLDSVRTSGNAQPHAVTFPPEYFAEISIFPYHVDTKFSEVVGLLPEGALAEMPSVKLGLKLIKAIAKNNEDRVLVLRGEDEISFLLDNVKAVGKAARKGHVFGYSNPASRFTTYNNLVKLHYKQELYRGGEEDKLSAFAAPPSFPTNEEPSDSAELESSDLASARFEYFSAVSSELPPQKESAD